MKKEDLKTGDFVKGRFKYGSAYGIILKIASKHVVIQKHEVWYNDYTPTDKHMNLTIARIFEVGLTEKETIKQK